MLSDGATVPLVGASLSQPTGGESLQKDHLNKYGEGINNLAFMVDDMEETIKLMAAAGFPCIQYGKILSDGAYAYFDTIEPLKVYWKALKFPSGKLPVSAHYPK